MQPTESRPRHRRSRRSLIGLGVLAVAAVLALPAAADPTDPPGVAAKQQQAARALAEVDRLDADLGKAAEAYNAANLHLQRTSSALAENTRLLRFARANLQRARAAVAERIVQLYTDGDGPTLAEVVLGAGSLDEVIVAVDARERIVEQDARITREIERFGDSVRTRQALLRAQKQRAERLVAEKAERRRGIEGKLLERERLLASIEDEIARLRAQERVRQAELERQARARLAAQQAAAQALSSTATGRPLDNEPPATAAPDPAAPAQAPQAAAAPPARYGGVVAIAMRYLGIPYRWGGASPATGFDCSGFTMYVYAQIGVSLPHYTGAQWQLGTPVAREDLQPGDLVFFNGLGHEGIYIGGNQMIHAPRTGDVVKISPLTGWYDETYMGARRL